MPKQIDNYSPHLYWEKRLGEHFNLAGVGHLSVGIKYNEYLYRARVASLENGLSKIGRSLTGATVLEIGCGTGFFTEYCKQKNVKSYTGIDITQVSIRQLKNKYPEYRFIQADITKDQIDNVPPADIILIADVLYHITDDLGFQSAIQQIQRLIQPGGLLIISDVVPSKDLQATLHVKLRSLDHYRKILAENDFQIKIIGSIFVLLQPPIQIPSAHLGHRIWMFLWKFMHPLIQKQFFEKAVAWLFYNLDRIILRIKNRAGVFTVKWLFVEYQDDR